MTFQAPALGELAEVGNEYTYVTSVTKTQFRTASGGRYRISDRRPVGDKHDIHVWLSSTRGNAERRIAANACYAIRNIGHRIENPDHMGGPLSPSEALDAMAAVIEAANVAMQEIARVADEAASFGMKEQR
jgi:hypothetical protein